MTAGRIALTAALALVATAAACNPGSTSGGNYAGSVAGTVSPPASKTTVRAIFISTGDTISAALADTVNGGYLLQFLPPGAYTISAKGTGINLSKSFTLRSGLDTTGVNFP